MTDQRQKYLDSVLIESEASVAAAKVIAAASSASTILYMNALFSVNVYSVDFILLLFISISFSAVFLSFVLASIRYIQEFIYREGIADIRTHAIADIEGYTSINEIINLVNNLIEKK